MSNHFKVCITKDTDPVGPETHPKGEVRREPDDRGAGVREPRHQLRLHRPEQQEDTQLRLGQLPSSVSEIVSELLLYRVVHYTMF